MSTSDQLAKLIADVAAATERGLKRAAGFVADIETQLVPVDTSALKQTIRVVRVSADHYQVIAGDPTATRPNDGRAVDYAPYVEYGTPNSAAQPFVAPAAKAVDVGKEVAAEIRKVLR